MAQERANLNLVSKKKKKSQLELLFVCSMFVYNHQHHHHHQISDSVVIIYYPLYSRTHRVVRIAFQYKYSFIIIVITGKFTLQGDCCSQAGAGSKRHLRFLCRALNISAKDMMKLCAYSFLFSSLVGECDALVDALGQLALGLLQPGPAPRRQEKHKQALHCSSAQHSRVP